MLRYLHLRNVGPAPEMEAELGQRINLITGDNGLGKSFLLDIAWWALTRTWPAKVNTALVSGHMARPRGPGPATIDFLVDGAAKPLKYTHEFDRQRQIWAHKAGRPSNPGLVLYAQVDGSFSLWDPARNYARSKDDGEIPAPPPAYVFTPQEVWHGLKTPEGTMLCNGLFADWATWQNKGNEAFVWLTEVLEMLSPEGGEKLKPGGLIRIPGDAREVPTIRMPYGLDVPVVHASAGVRRILALAYLLVWSWHEHYLITDQTEQLKAKQVIFLIDELEAHLHPRWQRQLLKPLLHIVESLADYKAQVQIIAATHSPLVAASMEPIFDPDLDAWFDLDLDTKVSPPQIQLQKRPFHRRGDVSSWLTSQAFDLAEARSLEAEKAIQDARALLRGDIPHSELLRIDAALRATMPEQDRFWIRWSTFVDSLQAAP